MSWSTFVLEVINFLVLVWILKRFLYTPVLNVIARRRAAIEKSLADAEERHADAEQLRTQYENRLADWDQERQRARDSLIHELDAERHRKLEQLQTALDQEREKMRVAEARRSADARSRMEETALTQGARFATHLLEQAAGPELESRLVDLAIDELAALDTARVAALHGSLAQAPRQATIATAFALPAQQRQRLETALAPLCDPDLPAQYHQDGTLVAGVRITLGAWVLGANLQDELQGFATLKHHEPQDENQDEDEGESA